MVSNIKDKIEEEIIEAADFNDIVIDAYNKGNGDCSLAAYHFFARSQVPAGSAAKKDRCKIPKEIPVIHSNLCNGCLKCISICPDSAIGVKVIRDSDIDFYIENFTQDESKIDFLKNKFSITSKFYNDHVDKSDEKGKLILAIDPEKCKSCSECTKICNSNAIELLENKESIFDRTKLLCEFVRELPETETFYIDKKEILDIVLSQETQLFTGGTNSCKGCTEATAIKMMLAVTGYFFGKENVGIINSAQCEKFYLSTYPFIPFLVSSTNVFSCNGIALAIGIRNKWDQMGWHNKKLWFIGNEDLISYPGLAHYW